MSALPCPGSPAIGISGAASYSRIVIMTNASMCAPFRRKGSCDSLVGMIKRRHEALHRMPIILASDRPGTGS